MNNITILVFKLSDFCHSDKALWLRGIWHTPRLIDREIQYFFPLKYIASKEGEVYIPSSTVRYFINKNAQAAATYKYQMPSIVRKLTVPVDMWQDFLAMYDYINPEIKQY